MDISGFNPAIALESIATMNIKSPLTGADILSEGNPLTLRVHHAQSTLGRNLRSEIDRKKKDAEFSNDDTLDLLCGLIESIDADIETKIDGAVVKFTKKTAHTFLNAEPWLAVQIANFVYNGANFEPKN
jgi:hypothetical protein